MDGRTDGRTDGRSVARVQSERACAARTRSSLARARAGSFCCVEPRGSVRDAADVPDANTPKVARIEAFACAHGESVAVHVRESDNISKTGGIRAHRVASATAMRRSQRNIARARSHGARQLPVGAESSLRGAQATSLTRPAERAQTSSVRRARLVHGVQNGVHGAKRNSCSSKKGWYASRARWVDSRLAAPIQVWSRLRRSTSPA